MRTKTFEQFITENSKPYIASPSQTKTILKALNSKEMQKWTGTGKLTDFEIQNEIFDGGKEYAEGMIEYLEDVKPYGYKAAVQAFKDIMAYAEGTR